MLMWAVLVLTAAEGAWLMLGGVDVDVCCSTLLKAVPGSPDPEPDDDDVAG